MEPPLVCTCDRCTTCFVVCFDMPWLRRGRQKRMHWCIQWPIYWYADTTCQGVSNNTTSSPCDPFMHPPVMRLTPSCSSLDGLLTHIQHHVLGATLAVRHSRESSYSDCLTSHRPLHHGPPITPSHQAIATPCPSRCSSHPLCFMTCVRLPRHSPRRTSALSNADCRSTPSAC